MSGDNDVMEWDVHTGGDTSDSFELSEDGRIPVYLSQSQKYYTLFGGIRRPWKGAEPSISNDNVVGDFNDFTLRGEKESWWINRFDFQLAPQDFINKKYRQSLPQSGDGLIIADTGQLVDPSGDLLPYQPSTRSDRGDFLNADAYIFPPKFIDLLPELGDKYPDLTQVQLYQQYLESQKKKNPPQPEMPAQPETTQPKLNFEYYRQSLQDQYPGVSQGKLKEVFQSAERQGSTGSLRDLSFYFGELDGQGVFDDDREAFSVTNANNNRFNNILPQLRNIFPSGTSDDKIRDKYEELLDGGDILRQDDYTVMKEFENIYGDNSGEIPDYTDDEDEDDTNNTNVDNSKAVVQFTNNTNNNTNTNDEYALQISPYHLNKNTSSQMAHSRTIYDARNSQIMSGLRLGAVDEGNNKNEQKNNNISRPFGIIVKLFE